MPEIWGLDNISRILLADLSKQNWPGEEDLEEGEKQIFEREWPYFIESLKHQSSMSIVQSVYEQLNKSVTRPNGVDESLVMFLIRAFKKRSGQNYGGMNPENGNFAVVPLSTYPRLIRGTNTWDYSISAGWNDIIGSPSSPIGQWDTDGNRRMVIYSAFLMVNCPPPVAIKLGVNEKIWKFPNDLLAYHPVNETYYRLLVLPGTVVVYVTHKHWLQMLFRESAPNAKIIPIGLIAMEFGLWDNDANLYSATALATPTKEETVKATTRARSTKK